MPTSHPPVAGPIIDPVPPLTGTETSLAATLPEPAADDEVVLGPVPHAHPWHDDLEPGFTHDAKGRLRNRYDQCLDDPDAYPRAHALADRLRQLYLPPRHRVGPPWRASLLYSLSTHGGLNYCHTVFRHGRNIPTTAIHDHGLWLRQVLGTQGVHPIYKNEPVHHRLFLDVDVTGPDGRPYAELPDRERLLIVRVVATAARNTLGEIPVHILHSGHGGLWLQCWFSEPGTSDDLRHVLNVLRNRIWFICQMVGRSVVASDSGSWVSGIRLDVDPLSGNGCRTWGSPNGGAHALWLDQHTALPVADQYGYTMAITPSGSLADLAADLRATTWQGPEFWRGLLYDGRDARRLRWQEAVLEMRFHLWEVQYDTPLWDIPENTDRLRWLRCYPGWEPWVGLWTGEMRAMLGYDPDEARERMLARHEEWVGENPARRASWDDWRARNEEDRRRRPQSGSEVVDGKPALGLGTDQHAGDRSSPLDEVPGPLLDADDTPVDDDLDLACDDALAASVLAALETDDADVDGFICGVVDATIRDTIPGGCTNQYLVGQGHHLMNYIVAGLLEAGIIGPDGEIGEADRLTLVEAVMAHCDSTEGPVALEADIRNKVSWYLGLIRDGQFHFSLRSNRPLSPRDTDIIDALVDRLHLLRPSLPPARLRAVLTQLRWCSVNSDDGLIRITYGELSRRILTHHGERIDRMWLCRFLPLLTLCYPRGRSGTIDDSAVIVPLLRMVRKGDRNHPDADGNTWSIYEPLSANWQGPWGDSSRPRP